MIQLSVFYPTTEGAAFDHDYYRDEHVPLCVATWNPVGTQIEKGIDGPHAAAVHFRFETLEAFQAALGGPGTEAIREDVANYTTITSFIQVSEIVS